jgi:hypothetical protein
MSTYKSAATWWEQMNANRSSLMLRCETLSSLTLPHICMPMGMTHENYNLTNDYSSLGAQAAIHLVNKLHLTLFRPGVPFFRMKPDKKGQKELQVNGMDEKSLAQPLSKVELAAVRELDNSGQRPKLNTCLEHLVVTGNVLLITEEDHFRVMGLRYFCVKRNYKGEWIRLVVREEICADELDESVIPYVRGYQAETKVCLYKVLVRAGKKITMTQWVDDVQLPDEFGGSWPIHKCPYNVCTWMLPDESDYGIGLVQQYWGDLEVISNLAQSVAEGAQVGTEMRWAVDPTSTTKASDLNKSKNGDFIPARKDDITPVYGGNPEAINTSDALLQRYERRVAAGFLMQSATTRNAERVTAEEVRMQALELETAYGGTYSAIARDLQGPVALWCLARSGNPIEGTGLEASVITGLDALTRNAELESLRAALSDMGMIAQLPEGLQLRLKWEPLAAFVGAGRGTDLKPFVMTDAEFAKQQRQEQQARVAEQAAMDGGKAAAQVTAQGTTQ